MGAKKGRKREKPDGAGPVQAIIEEQKEAVAESISAWRRLLRPRVLKGTAIILAIIIVIVFAFKVYGAVTEDLVMLLTPATAGITLANGESVEVSFDLRTNNYLFCEAACSYELRDATGNGTAQRLTLTNSSARITLPFTAPAKGEGQLLSQLAVTCSNVKKRLCARNGASHVSTALITLGYGPSPEERAARTALQEPLPAHLARVEELDLLVQEVDAYVAFLGAGDASLEGLAEEAAALDAMRDRAVRRAREAVTLWEAEEYAAIALDDETDAFLAGNRTMERLLGYVAAQRRLVTILENLTAVFPELNASGRVLEGEEASELAGIVAALGRLAVRVEELPAERVGDRLAVAGESWHRIRALQEEARDTLAEERKAGERLLASVTAPLTIENGSDVGPATIAESLSSYRALCDALGEVNLTANSTAPFLGELQPFLDRCGRVADASGLATPPRARPKRILLPAVDTEPLAFPLIAVPAPVCCDVNGCGACCDEGCGRPLPILFVHGHSMNLRNSPEYSLEAFTTIQQRLQEERVAIDAGSITPYDAHNVIARGAWQRNGFPVSARATYYYDAFLNGGSYILSAEKSESIDTYAIRLQEIIDVLLERTGSDRVVIVAHSMGGLVARRYLRIFGEGRVAGLLMVGTPNHGVESSVASFCPVLGADKECAEMRADSAFLAKLNDPSRQPAIPMAVIAGVGCDTHNEEGDGVVTAASASLPGAAMFTVEGSCTATEKLHTEMLHPDAYPATYALIVEWLSLFSDPSSP